MQNTKIEKFLPFASAFIPVGSASTVCPTVDVVAAEGARGVVLPYPHPQSSIPDAAAKNNKYSTIIIIRKIIIINVLTIIYLEPIVV